eukprot:TRINITY_DN355_c1_g3_i2.p1 TRINITY_DN355_c1_g3~~TRINITY_DN355_c1_g3_i2.p1  ORF type:complete len:503 (-),score=100.60 TRINITY_DN355_c1_g3_i2:272-1780(-)
MRARVLKNVVRGERKKVLTFDNMSEKVKRVQYAVRGPIVIRAYEHERTLREQPGKLPFSRITYCNIGNPQQLGQPPITFFRQVLALTEYPDLLNQPGIERYFPEDAIERARLILHEGGGTGAYSESMGRAHVRKDIASFINMRDGFDPSAFHYSSPDRIFVTDGASPAVQSMLRMIIRGENDGIMIPIPQYPLYSASIPLYGGKPISYFLDESKNWELSIEELTRSVKEARASGIVPRALVVINPGNPTGSCLPRKNMEDIVRFCAKENILLMADEVYQENVYVKEHKPFVSFKKIVHDLKDELKDYSAVELLSFHSTSKGFIGECGKRGGYVEFTNIDEQAKQEFYKLVSVSLCPNIVGQLMMSLMVNPPKPGTPSYKLYAQERDSIYSSLKKRSEMVSNKLNSLKGISCNPAEGALYLFPKITLPKKAIDEAVNKKMQPDMLYCLELLDSTGLCVVPGSGFGQKEGEYHFRTTFLPNTEHLSQVLDQFTTFHNNFLNRYS